MEPGFLFTCHLWLGDLSDGTVRFAATIGDRVSPVNYVRDFHTVRPDGTSGARLRRCRSENRSSIRMEAPRRRP